MSARGRARIRANGDGRDPAGEAFWRFSLALYARPGVADALIGLQDRAGSDVNLILFALWLGARYGHELGAAEIADARAAIAELNGLLTGLRALRRQLKASVDRDLRALRRNLLHLELAAERQVEFRLVAWFAEQPSAAAGRDRRAAADANLAIYLGEEAASPEAEMLRQAVAALMRCA